ncbi:MAG: alanine--tRNA ligase [FCB group bacterium]|nr:alanine--tRNA ligase [FCB group bacterium]
MDSKTIRESFIQFFRSKDHKFVRSAPVIPWDDPTLLFTNAGMNQFKPVFLGEEAAKFSRAVNSQKCIRVSGKHNDLEEVGQDTYHHTFFEMLGNWSFGDYYKAEAIRWAWELLTEIWGLEKSRLWATVYKDDDEAFNLWVSETDIGKDRILRFGAKENFWEMGDTGPCGPCSEIHYYIGDNMNQQSADGVNASPEYWELWNLVFMQNFRHESGKLTDLPNKHVDTGAGLERIVAVLQGKQSNYDTDLFMPIISSIETITGETYAERPVPMRVIADHIRMLTVSIADGAMPANDGRGYVLRRILRRASRFGRILGMEEPFLYQLVEAAESILGSIYPEISDKKTHIQHVINAEEKSFNETLNRGLIHFEKIIQHLSGNEIPGKEAFRLYDTYGFPLDLTQLMAREHQLTVDESGFNEAMKEQRCRAKAAGKFKARTQEINWHHITEGESSDFCGYDSLSTQSVIRKIADVNGQKWLILDKTPFYAESGGQVGDLGIITGEGIDLRVLDTQKDGSEILHICEGDFPENISSPSVNCQVDVDRRQAIKLNHTATHLLHRALKDVLGDHVHQAGSLVGPEHLRFDLTHFEKMSPEQLNQVESIVNREILKNRKLNVALKAFDEAREAGAEALFGEKYGDVVRVVTVGDFSKELCGGTHVERTGDIGSFKILEETSLAAGIRRIVAVTGMRAFSIFQERSTELQSLAAILRCSERDLEERITQLLKQKKELEKNRHRSPVSLTSISELISKSQTLENISVLVSWVEAEDDSALKTTGDQLLEKWPSGIAVLASKLIPKPVILVVVTQDLIKSGYHAGKIAKAIGKIMDGGGGGRPHLATAGGKDSGRLKQIINGGAQALQSVLTQGKSE